MKYDRVCNPFVPKIERDDFLSMRMEFKEIFQLTLSLLLALKNSLRKIKQDVTCLEISNWISLTQGSGEIDKAQIEINRNPMRSSKRL